MKSYQSTSGTFSGLRRMLLALAVVALTASNTFAEDFFWSTLPLNGGASNADIDIATSTVGDTGTLYLYYDATTLLGTDNFGMNLAWLDDDIIAFKSAETLNYDVTTFFNGIQPRWDSFGPALSVTDNLVTFVGAGASSPAVATGIDENFDGSGPFGEIDAGYDAGAGAFLVATVGWERVALGSTSLDVQAPVVDGGIPTVAGVNFGVTAIPEPNSIGIVALGLLGLVLRRRHN